MVARDPQTAQIGEEILPFELGYLPEFFQKKAALELSETPEKIVLYTKQLKEMAKLEKKLMFIDFDDDFLVQLLRSRKFNLERTFTSLKTFVSFTRKTPESYSNFKFDETIKVIQQEFISILPWRCQDGSTVIIVELDNWKPQLISVDELKRSIVLLLLQALRDPMTQVNGFKVIFDVKSSSFRYLRHCTPHNLWLLSHGMQECLPGRFKGIHIINDSLTFKTAWLIVKHFLSEKIQTRFHFHSSRKTLLDFFPKAILPTSFGGELENYDQTVWLKNAMTPEALAKLGGGALQHL